MARPIMLYHWAPVSRRKQIEKRGLMPNRKPTQTDYRHPHVCFARTPSAAWALSATHSEKRGKWDLWCCWSDVGKMRTLTHSGKWWLYEYRIATRIAKKDIWFVGTREFVPRKSPKGGRRG